MKYLLDINTLIALGHTAHVHHAKAIGWYLSISKASASLATCSITELGFVRVTVQTRLQSDVDAARKALEKLKSSSSLPFALVSDDLGVDRLPSFAKTPNRLTDGHLLELAHRQGMKLVTLDKGIPGAHLID